MSDLVSKEVVELENLLDVCDAKPKGEDLPQVANQKQVVLMTTQNEKIYV